VLEPENPYPRSYLTATFMKKLHEIYTLNNKHQNIGLGIIGELPLIPMKKNFFRIRKMTNAGGIRHSSWAVKKSSFTWWSWKFAIKCNSS
jgi:hypothetical protein